MNPIILASASPRRQEILTLAGIPFVVAPAAQEFAPAGLPLEQRVQALAHSKAAQVAPLYPGQITLGSDTMVAVDDRVLGKPHSPEEAVEMLLLLQGRTHRVLTGVWLMVADAAGTAADELPPTGLLVFCGLRNSHMDRFLQGLRHAGIEIPHKAVLTPTNQHWTVFQLAWELERERRHIHFWMGQLLSYGYDSCSV